MPGEEPDPGAPCTMCSKQQLHTRISPCQSTRSPASSPTTSATERQRRSCAASVGPTAAASCRALLSSSNRPNAAGIALATSIGSLPTAKSMFETWLERALRRVCVLVACRDDAARSCSEMVPPPAAGPPAAGKSGVQPCMGMMRNPGTWAPSPPTGCATGRARFDACSPTSCPSPRLSSMSSASSIASVSSTCALKTVP
mmetsp:Transcript_45913/g.107239  ORF Transcript_45913/g.107239 Transcript_45913/m.107239 type:complete len:200 (-) Transcript_45913:200-799(-)